MFEATLILVSNHRVRWPRITNLRAKRIGVTPFSLHFHIDPTTCAIFWRANMTPSKRGNKKQPTDTPEKDFKAFVREPLARLCESQ